MAADLEAAGFRITLNQRVQFGESASSGNGYWYLTATCEVGP